MRMPLLAAFNGPIAQATLRTSCVLGLRLVLQAGTLLLVARMLGPQQFGAFAGVAALAVVLGTLSTFGTHLVLLGEVSREPARSCEVLCFAVPNTLLFGSVLLAIYLLIHALLLSETIVPMSALIAIGATEMLLQPLFSLLAAEQLALGRVARSQLMTTLPLALRVAAAGTVFLLDHRTPLAAYGYGYLLASLIALGTASFFMPTPWPTPRRWRIMSKAELLDSAGYAAISITATSPAELDKTLAAQLLPLGSAGLYAAAARVIGAATLPVIAMMLSALPRLFREGQDQPRRTANLLRWVFFSAFLYSIGLAALLWFIAPAFEWMFGPKFNGIEHVIHWLCLAIPGMALRIAAGSVLMALGKPWMRVGFEVIGMVVLVIAAATFTTTFNIAGMPLALACSEWAMTLTGWGLIRKIRKGQHPKERYE